MTGIFGLNETSFNTNGGSAVASQMLLRGETITRPDNPVKADYIFDGWFEDNDSFKNEWDFSIAPDRELALYAKWTVVFVPEPILYAAVNITGPVKDASPNVSATGIGNFSAGTVYWSPGDDPFLAETVYTAAVTLTADSGYAFTQSSTASINGQSAIITNNTGQYLTISYTFAATDSKGIDDIVIADAPVLNYFHGDTLDLSALRVTIIYDDSSVNSFGLNEFSANNIGTNFANGMLLLLPVHNANEIIVSVGNITRAAGVLNIGQKELTVAGVSHTKQYDGTPETTGGVTVTLNGIITSDAGNVIPAAVEAVYTSANAGTTTVTISDISLAGTASGNYFVTLPSNPVAVTGGGITKADGAAINQFIVSGNRDNLIITVDTAALASPTGQLVEYNIGTTNNIPETGWIDTGVFANRVIGITYYVFARSRQDDNYNAGAAEISTPITFYPEQSFPIEVADISGGDFNLVIPTNIVLVRSNAVNRFAEINITNAGGYIIQWYYNAVEITGPSVSNGGATLTLNVSDNPADAGYYTPYNIVLSIAK